MRNCATCKFFVDGTATASCRRLPPEVTNNGGGSAYPPVRAVGYGCGEHRLGILRILKLIFRRRVSYPIEQPVPH
jgi:hypothetical protein